MNTPANTPPHTVAAIGQNGSVNYSVAGRRFETVNRALDVESVEGKRPFDISLRAWRVFIWVSGILGFTLCHALGGAVGFVFAFCPRKLENVAYIHRYIHFLCVEKPLLFSFVCSVFIAQLELNWGWMRTLSAFFGITQRRFSWKPLQFLSP